MLLCHHPEVGDIWDEALKKLTIWLNINHTRPDLAKAIICGLRMWYDDTTPMLVPASAHKLFINQGQLGWQAAFEGRWLKDWANTQSLHFAKLGRHPSGVRWLSQLIQKLWAISWDLWEHRNGIATTRAAEELRQELIPQVETEFNLGKEGLSHYEATLFRLLLSELLNKHDNAYLQSWLRRIQAARQRAAESHKAREEAAYLNFYAFLQRRQRRIMPPTLPH